MEWEFTKMLYKKLYDGIIDNRLSNPLDKHKGIYLETHHILPKCMGGDNTESNLINLTAEEHMCCHYLLMKICKNSEYKHSLLKAFLCMNVVGIGQKRIKISPKMYEKLKIEHSKQMSIDYSGEKNTNYNKTYMYNIKTKKMKFINKNDSLPEGWEWGYPKKGKLHPLYNKIVITNI